MHSTLFFGLAALGYLLALFMMLDALRQREATHPPTRRAGSLLAGWLAVLAHGLALAALFGEAGAPSLNFSNALALVMIIVNIIVLTTASLRPGDKLGVIVFPLTTLILLLKLALPNEGHIVSNYSWPMQAHIFSSLVAYSVLNIAAIQAILLAIQDHCLRKRHTGGMLIRSLPPLQGMESMLFRLIAAGLLWLTLSLVSGFAFMENMFAQHLAHKTVLSMLAWMVFAILLAGRFHYGWRGQTAIRWTLAGFASLMLAYFGSKMVLELILGRT